MPRGVIRINVEILEKELTNLLGLKVIKATKITIVVTYQFFTRH